MAFRCAQFSGSRENTIEVYIWLCLFFASAGHQGELDVLCSILGLDEPCR